MTVPDTVPDTFHGLLAALSSNPVFLSGIVYLILGYAYAALPQLTSQAKAAGAAILPFALASAAYVTGAALNYWPWGIEPFYQVIFVAVGGAGFAKLIHSGTERASGHLAGLFTLIGQQVNGTQNWQTGGDQFHDATNIEGGVAAGNIGAVTSNPAAPRILGNPSPLPVTNLRHIWGSPLTADTTGEPGGMTYPAKADPPPAPEPAPLPPVVLAPAPEPAPAPQFSIAELEAWIAAKRAAETDRIAASERGDSG